MRTAYALSSHAQRRMQERGIHPYEVIAALDGLRHLHPDGVIEFFDPDSRVAIHANVHSRLIITVYRRQSRQSKIRLGTIGKGGVL